MVVVVAGGDERGLVAHPLLQLEAEHADVEAERALDVGDLQVDVADVDAGIDRGHVATIARAYRGIDDRHLGTAAGTVPSGRLAAVGAGHGGGDREPEAGAASPSAPRPRALKRSKAWGEEVGREAGAGIG